MRQRRALSMLLTSLAVMAAIAVANPAPASAVTIGQLRVAIQHPTETYCLSPWTPLHSRPCVDNYQPHYTMTVVAWVGDSPRYSISSNYTGECLVAFASTGRPGHYTCNSAWADQVWGFQYVRSEGSLPLFWLRNKQSGKCLALNPSYSPQVFMTTCGNYRDQLWRAPGT